MHDLPDSPYAALLAAEAAIRLSSRFPPAWWTKEETSLTSSGQRPHPLTVAAAVTEMVAPAVSTVEIQVHGDDHSDDLWADGAEVTVKTMKAT